MELSVEESLKQSLLDESTEHFFVMDRGTRRVYGAARNGQKYMTVHIDEKEYTLFAFQYKASLSAMKKTGKAKIYYLKKGKFGFKYLRVTPF